MSLEIREMTKDDLDRMVAEHNELNPDRPVKESTLNALIRYRDRGIKPGDFLTAVLENNLMRSFGLADSYNRATLFQITSFLYNEMPSNSWGSPEIVRAWLDGHKDRNG